MYYVYGNKIIVIVIVNVPVESLVNICYPFTDVSASALNPSK